MPIGGVLGLGDGIRMANGLRSAHGVCIVGCRLLGLGWLLGFGSGCGRPTEPAPSVSVALPVPAADQAWRTGDLDRLREQGRLRILVARGADTGLPRAGSPLHMHETQAQAFARSLGLEPELVYVENLIHLIPALLHGRGDLIAANLTVTPWRQQRLAFSRPVGRVVEQLVVAMSDSRIRSKADLPGKTIGIPQLTSFWDTASHLAAERPDVTVTALPGQWSADDILDGVVAGEIDATIQDSNVMASMLAYRSDVRVVEDLTGERPFAWAVRPESVRLLEELNRFVDRQKLAFRPLTTYRADFPEIRRRGVLRVLTRNNGATYFLWRGELLGFEYEMVRHFARQHQLEVEMVVAPGWDDLIPMLHAGKGDLIASFLTISDERRAQGVAFSTPYNVVSEVVVSRASEADLHAAAGLAGRTIAVRRSSSYWQTLQGLLARGVKFDMQEVPETMETETIIGAVADGTYDLTVADSHLVDLERAWRNDIRACFPVKENVQHGWAVREGDTALLQAVNAFWGMEYRGRFANQTYHKYFRSRKAMAKHRRGRVDGPGDGSLSPYDHVVKPIAAAYDFDWRLITAQMYQESRFDPSARSFAGALGLLQVMPRTGKQMGYVNLRDPEAGLRAGVAYLRWVSDRFDPERSLRDQPWFALAAYNAGIGHVEDARRLARERGWDANRWFEQVEKAMLLLAEPKYANRARHGYVRGREPVRYVREIRERYWNYVALTDGEVAEEVLGPALASRPPNDGDVQASAPAGSRTH